MLLANAMRLLQWAVGDIFITTNDINPSTRFGGTWERFAKGKTLVGYDDSDTDFNEVNKIGGEKTHKLTVDEMPSHKHDLWKSSQSGYNQFYDGHLLWSGGSVVAYQTSGGKTEYTGGSQAHNNLQPYITVYFWRKTA